jgi:hypothetical protein
MASPDKPHTLVSTKRALFAFGALGGVTPTVVNLASTYVSAPATPWPALGLVFGVLLWAFVGGVVALTNASLEVRQAIFAGIAAPAIILNIVAGATDPNNVHRRNVELFGSVAYAQDKSTLDNLPKTTDRAVIISPAVTGGVPTVVSLPVSAEVQKEGKVVVVPMGVVRDLNTASGFSVPEGALKIYLSGKPIEIIGTVTNVDLSVKTKPSWGGDFLWALGAQRNYSIQEIIVSPAKTPP